MHMAYTWRALRCTERARGRKIKLRRACRANSNTTKADEQLGWLEQRFVKRLAWLLRQEAGLKTKAEQTRQLGYDDIITTCHNLLAEGALRAQLAGDRVLRRLITRPLLQLFKLANVLLPRRLMSELAAIVTPRIAPWLVGPTVRASGVGLPKGGWVQCNDTERERPPEPSALICKCKLLDESNCVGVCANICQVPTQSVFQELGLPVSMEPDLETRSCMLRFGVEPTPPEQDETMNAPCYTDCKAAMMAKQSHQSLSCAQRPSTEYWKRNDDDAVNDA